MNILKEVKDMTTAQAGAAVHLAIIAGLGTWGMTVHSIKLQQPSAITGFVKDPPGQVLVTLNNGGSSLHADKNTGWLRFENVEIGRHQLKFEHDGYGDLQVFVDVKGPGDNSLTEDVTLTSAADIDGPLPPVHIKTAFIPGQTRDGSQPDIDYEDVIVTASRVRAAAAITEGWVYLGSRDDPQSQIEGVNIDMVLEHPNQSIELVDGVPIWHDVPEKTGFRVYQLASFEGVAQPGQRLAFADITKEVGKGHYWAKVRFVNN